VKFYTDSLKIVFVIYLLGLYISTEGFVYQISIILELSFLLVFKWIKVVQSRIVSHTLQIG
jgi:hypothetical protein